MNSSFWFQMLMELAWAAVIFSYGVLFGFWLVDREQSKAKKKRDEEKDAK